MAAKPRPWLTRNLVVLSLVSLTQDAASELMYPLLPLFLTGILAAPAIALGVVEGFAELVAGLSKFYAGKASDHIGRKTLITSGYGLAAIGKVFVASALAWPMVLVGRAIDRVGKGIRSTPRDAMITSDVAKEHFTQAFGFHRSADTLGAVIGPIFALLGLSVLNNDIRAVMWWAIIPAVLSMILTLLIRETQAPKRLQTNVQKVRMPSTFWKTAIPLIVISAINIPDTLLLLRLSELGVSAKNIVLAYISFNVVYTVSAYPAGVIASRLPPRLVYAIGMGAFGITFFAIGQFREQNVWLFVIVALYGLFPALTDGIGKSLIAMSAPKEVHGQAQGIFQSLAGGSILIAGLWAGAIWTLGSGQGSLPFTIAGGLGLIAGGYLFTTSKRMS